MLEQIARGGAADLSAAILPWCDQTLVLCPELRLMGRLLTSTANNLPEELFQPPYSMRERCYNRQTLTPHITAYHSASCCLDGASHPPGNRSQVCEVFSGGWRKAMPDYAADRDSPETKNADAVQPSPETGAKKKCRPQGGNGHS